MLKALGEFTGALFSLFLAILWGGMGWYLDGGMAPKSAVYGVYALSALAFMGAILGLLRANAKAKQSTAGVASASMNRARESEEALVERVMAKLGNADGSPPPPKAASITDDMTIATEHDEIVARVLKKLETEKATQDAKSPPPPNA